MSFATEAEDAPLSLVLGATSLVGRFLLPLLRAEGSAFVACSRHAPSGAAPDERWVVADLGTPESLGAVLSVREVYSLSPIWLLPPALPALRALGMKRLVAFSSTSRFTKAESSSPEERAVAAKLAKGEDETIAFCRANGVAWTILRPTLIYAEGQDGNVSRLASLANRLGFLPLAGQGEGLRQPVHGEDLARGARAAMLSPAASDRAYDLPGGETLSYRTMVERVFEGMGRRSRIVSIPAPLFQAALTVARPFLPGITTEMGARIATDLVFDPEPARRDFGWAPRDFHPRF